MRKIIVHAASRAPAQVQTHVQVQTPVQLQAAAR